jgi:16S rRNA (guanine(1405)-N(7))-methyltransferase
VVDESLEKLVQAVQESAKYRHVSADLIRRLGGRELSRRRNLKEVIKETKNTLHQVAGAYLDSTPRYAEGIARMEASRDLDTLTWMMGQHASTRERLPYLAEFYSTIFAALPPVHSILDIACGLNPLALPWMNLPPDLRYDAYDLYSDMMDFLNAFFRYNPWSARAHLCDAVANPPAQEADLALILKFLPVLEQTERGVTLDWLRRLQARYLLVTFPTRSLGGRGKGMTENYESRFRILLQQTDWAVERFLFPNELAFLVHKTG